MGKTIIEKILSNHAGRSLAADDFAICKVDFCFSQDGTSSIVIERLKELGIKNIINKEKFCMVIDHNSPSPNQGVSAVHKRMRDFAKKYGVIIYDIGCGVCHQIIPEQGHVYPGELILGADSHTTTYGALGAASFGVGSTDLAISLATGKNWFRVPRTIKIILKGTLKTGIYAKDIILHIIGDLGADGATYKSIEFSGKIAHQLSMDGRFTICNMVTEMGAKCGFMPVDITTVKWFKKHTNRKIKITSSNGDAQYDLIKEYDLSHISPQISKPHNVDNVSPIEEVEGRHIDEVFLGTCTNGRTEDLKIAAKILLGKHIKPGLKFIIAPASSNIYLEAIKLGLIEVFLKAGAVVISPGCGPCVGTHMGIPSDGETVLSTANRNFKGRMGNPRAEIFLASPATAAASAINGTITDPRNYLR